MYKIILLMIFSSIFSAKLLYASDSALEQGKVILTVLGNFEKNTTGFGVKFDRKMLMSFKQTTIATTTPWTSGINNFKGPTIEDVINSLGVKGTQLIATALNGYKVSIPMSDIKKYPVIIALRRNDLILSVRQKGPGWVIYPWDKYQELRTNVYYTRAIWQLKSLEIR
ncbi:MAG: hypothetical protein V7784_00615 [Oceanospirillaceae bacterium]